MVKRAGAEQSAPPLLKKQIGSEQWKGGTYMARKKVATGKKKSIGWYLAHDWQLWVMLLSGNYLYIYFLLCSYVRCTAGIS